MERQKKSFRCAVCNVLFFYLDHPCLKNLGLQPFETSRLQITSASIRPVIAGWEEVTRRVT